MKDPLLAYMKLSEKGHSKNRYRQFFNELISSDETELAYVAVQANKRLAFLKRPLLDAVHNSKKIGIALMLLRQRKLKLTNAERLKLRSLSDI